MSNLDIVKKRYPSGSIWRKWDLHVHTPESHNFKGDWEKFKTQLQKANCDVIGINDYFSVAGYKKLKKEIRDDTLDIGEKTILPVVEMRMTDVLQNKNTTTNAGIYFNFHIIFNDEINIDDIESFIKSLKYEDTTIRKYYEDKEKLATIKVSFTETLKRLKEDKEFEDKFLVYLPYSEYGGIEDIDPYTDSWIKGNFTKKSHILGSSNQNQIDFFLWKLPKFTQKEYEKWLGHRKPCIKGSDSHSSSDSIGNLKDGASNPIEKFCWIKADPTFEGLKQIIYEPEDRVRIQRSKPEEKKNYQIIDKVRFIDDSFYPEEISLNQNLTTIIGGKSTGKSILLRNIAQTIDPEEVSKRLEEVKIEPYLNEVSDFQIIWKDRQEHKKTEGGVDKKIIYIPQSYLNRLVDKKEAETSIDDIIKNILEQEEDTKNVFIQLQSQNREIANIITQYIEDLFYKENDIKNLNDYIKKIGDKKGIESEVEKLKIETTELKKKAGMKEDDIDKYNSTVETLKNILSDIELLEKDLQSLNTLKSQNNFDIFTETQDILDSLDLDPQKALKKNLHLFLEEIEIKWKATIEAESKKLKNRKKVKHKDLEDHEKIFNPLYEKAKKSESFNEKINKLKEEESKLKEIIKEEKNLENLNTEYKKIVKNIVENHSKLFNNLLNAKASISKQRSITKDQDLEFDIEIVFRNMTFQNDCINTIFDQRKLGQFENGILQEYIYSEEANFKTLIEKIIQAILNKKLNLKSAYSKKEAITKLTQSWFIFSYKIKQNGDDISEMSPGNKSFVLLKLLIELDKSRCPILLDQPEDDLDNRSVYNELVTFIRAKKKERQIIIATHNPNLVVGADSECIIVANQNGDKSKNRTYKFEYTQGALENTFLNEESECVLEQRRIQEHVCDILEGGKDAFEKRKKKYNF